MPEPRPPPECANCGAVIPRDARACPTCGADERSGWREGSVYDGLDLPEIAWSEDRGESPSERSSTAHRVNGIRWYWWAAGVLLLALLTGAVLGLR